MYLIGIDIGTQGVKGALFDAEGRCLARAFTPSRLHRPAPGAVEEDPEYQVASVCRVIRRCVTDSRVNAQRVAAIGIDGQMAGIIGVDRNGRHVTPYDSWLDTRCEACIDTMRRTAGDEIIRKTGGPASFNHGPKILWWMRERPRTFRSIARFVQPGGYAVMRLCGMGAEQAFIDDTYLHFSGFADNRRMAWDAGLCKAFDVPAEKLPRIVRPDAPVGELCRAMARRCGLPAGVRLVAGCGDTAASFLACGATRAGVAVDVAGTASVFAVTTDTFRADTRHHLLAWGRSATPGLWHPYAYINGGGLNLEWFREKATRLRGEKPIPLDRLDRAAARLTPALSDPFFIPHLGGRVSPAQPNLRGGWAGLTWDHTMAHLYRAVLEGVALEYALYRQALLDLIPGLAITQLRVTGGGEKSALWNRLKADYLDARVVRTPGGEGAAMGAAMLAGAGAGVLPGLPAAARTWVRTAEACRPRKSQSLFTRQRRDRYAALLATLDPWSKKEP